MKPSDNRTDSLVKEIQNEIISGRLKPGDKLLPLRNIAIKNNVSRSVVNSAISALSTKGYIRIVPRHYAIVNDFLSMGSLTILEDIFHSENEVLKKKMVKETLSCRLLVETDSARKIAMDPSIDLDRLLAIIEKEQQWRKKQNRNSADLCQLDWDFHACIVQLAGNMVFSLIYHTFDYLGKELIQSFYENPSVVDFVLSKHQCIYQALMERKPTEAVSLVEELLRHGEKELLKSINDGGDFHGLE